MIRPNHWKEDSSDPIGPTKQKWRYRGSEKYKRKFCATPRARRPALKGAKLELESKDPYQYYALHPTNQPFEKNCASKPMSAEGVGAVR